MYDTEVQEDRDQLQIRRVIEQLLEYAEQHAQARGEPKHGACWQLIERARSYLGRAAADLARPPIANDSAGARWPAFRQELYEGLIREELAVHFQPITNSHSGGVVGIEALARWNHPSRGAVTPATFIPMAERSGAIHELGRWVLDRACAQLASWDRCGLVFEYVSVNVSPVQLHHPEFVQYVDDALQFSGLTPDRLVLEITESLLLVHEHESARSLFAKLRARGIRFAIDDFGTGYSSLAYLQALPFSKLKLDRSFVANLPASRNDMAIVSAVAGLAHVLGLDLIAEGVETPAQLDALAKMGCDYIQGWLIGKPQSADDLARLFASGKLRMD
ncbi:putative bifunctional diguanylate cyclase/phosphodiesterase [Burkholderia vietnamiensis]|uniref:putative bifunctional diguanylate cyclase/phosphodiesterase n=1 Tax=Burkholderia vietnamiensis TaxID=60552 RepID=UPI001592C128|nr:EAL domain-containing protein [Burkholderia vietnamiensis]